MQKSIHKNKAVIEMDIGVIEQFIFFKGLQFTKEAHLVGEIKLIAMWERSSNSLKELYH